MKSPTYQQYLRQFIGVVNYYHNMWPMWSHMLALLTKITPNKRKYIWTIIEQASFDEINQIVDRDSLSTYT